MGEEERRQSGIAVIGDVPWGTHFCQFYKTKEDLIDLLVPYFKEGLAHNEFCMWVTSEPLNVGEATEALRRAVSDLDRYFEREQIEIIPHTDWYRQGGTFDADRVLNAWVEKLDWARAKGFEGMRLTGNTFWLETEEWKAFTAYEEKINRVIGQFRMVALCTYSLNKCSASEVIDVVSNHRFALIKRQGRWALIESSGQKRTEEELRRLTAELEQRVIQRTAQLEAEVVERRHAIEALRKVEQKLRTIVEHSTNVFYSHTPDHVLTYLSPQAHALLACEPETIQAKWMEFLTANPVNQKGIELTRRAIDTGQAQPSYELELKTMDGRIIWVAVHEAPVVQDGKTTLIVGSLTDITERKRAEKALQESEQRFRTIVETSPDGIFINRKSVDQIIYINSTGLRLLGATNPDQVLGKSVFQFLHPSFHAIVRDRIKQFSHLNVPSPVIEEKYLRLDGTPIDVEVTAVPLLYQGEAMFFVVIRDITTRKEMEVQARQLERLSALNKLLGGIAHELKNPLFILTGVVQLASEKVEQKQYGDLSTDCQKIQETAKRLTAIVERFLHLAQPVPFQPEQCSVQVVLQETLDSLGHELTSNRIRVVTTYAPDLPAIQADPAQLREVFQNLIQNAVQVMAEVHGKGTLTVSAALVTDAETRRQGDGARETGHDERGERRVSASEVERRGEGVTRGQGEGKNWIEVKIQDDGPGIAPEHQSKLFEPFFTTKPPDKATGLGLWIVRSDLMMLRGTVQMETDVGQGTTFIVKLPTVTEPPVSHDPQASESAQA